MLGGEDVGRRSTDWEGGGTASKEDLKVGKTTAAPSGKEKGLNHSNV